MTATIDTGAGAVTITAGSGAIWVPNGDDGTVTRIDPATNRARTVQVGGRPWTIGAGEGSVWLVDGDSGRLKRLDPRTGAPRGKPYDFGRYFGDSIEFQDRDIVVGDGAAWLYDGAFATLRIPMRNGVLGTATKIHVATTMALVGNSVWMSTVDPPNLFELDTRTGRVLGRTHSYEAAILAHGRDIWVNRSNIVSRIDPATGRAIATVKIGTDAELGLTQLGGRLFALNISDKTLTRFTL